MEVRSAKLIVTHRGRLAEQYGPGGVEKIDAAVAELIKADDGRGIETIYVHLDDTEEMQTVCSRPVRKNPTAVACKKAIDRIIAACPFDYIALLGSDDIIPHFNLPNPAVGFPSDDDREVPSDNPYACSSPFKATSPSSYLVPDRVLGRIPDVIGSKDPEPLLKYLRAAAASEPLSPSAFALDLMICCDSWSGSGSKCAASLARAAENLLLTPPTTDVSEPLRDRHRARLHMIKCHGAIRDPRFFGDIPAGAPVVLHSDSLKDRIAASTVVAAMCCYGAALFDPSGGNVTGLPIPNVYLQQGAAGYVGATCVAYVGLTEMQCGDRIACHFLETVLTGASLGTAFLDVKQRFMADINKAGRSPNAPEEKTMIEFVLLGDPSLRPVLSRDERSTIHAAAGVPIVGGGPEESIGDMMFDMKGQSPAAIAAERRIRRTYYYDLAQQLRAKLPKREAVDSEVPDSQFLTRTELEYLGVTKPIVHRVQRSVKQPEHGRHRPLTGAVTAALGIQTQTAAVTRTVQEETLQYYWCARKPHDRVIDATVVTVETDLDGNVLRKHVVVTA